MYQADAPDTHPLRPGIWPYTYLPLAIPNNQLFAGAEKPSSVLHYRHF